MHKCNNFLFVVLLLWGYQNISAQSITVYPDTVICSGDPITLYAEADGVLGTDTYLIEEIPYAPEPIGGTSMSMWDDTYIGGYDIGFDFCFFGEVYDEYFICSNGWISFDTPGPTWAGNWTPDGPIPDNATNVPKAAIMPAWTDWHTGLCTNCIHRELIGTAPFRKLVITYEDVPLYLCTGDQGTFQIILYESTNIIEHHLTEVMVCPTWDLGIATQGIHNDSGTEAYTVPGRNAEAWEANNEGWRFKPDQITWYELPSGTIIGYGDSLIVNPDVTTSYYAEVTFCDGTTASDTVTVSISSPFDVVYLAHEITCFGDTDAWIDLTVTGNTNPVTFLWNTGSTSDYISDLPPGTYTVVIEEEGGCSETWEFIMDEPPLLELGVADSNHITCFEGNDGMILLDANGGESPYLFFLNENLFTDSLFNSLSASTYIFTVKDQRGCWDTLVVSLAEPPPVEVDAGNTIIIQFGGQAQIDATTSASGILTINWIPAEGLSCTNCLNPVASPLATTLYQISVTDENGCQGMDIINLIVELDIILPNVFTPNGDGLNDFFHVNYDFIESGDIEIYDRWGETVFKTEDIIKGWDGTNGNKPQEIGAYIYVVRANINTGVQIVKTGTLTLLR